MEDKKDRYSLIKQDFELPCPFKKELPMTDFFKEYMPPTLVTVARGFHFSTRHDTPFIKPPWYHHEKFVRGQKFANDYYGSVNYAEMLSLIILFSFTGNIEPLIYTQRSDSPVKAGKRYLSTALRVLSWYEEDLWEKNTTAHRNILAVRALHKSTAASMCKHSKQELEQKTSLRNVIQPADIKKKSLSVLKEDFTDSCPAWVPSLTKSEVVVNQGEMSFTLFGFMGLVILYPEKLGIIGATKEDFEGFIHLWRVIGHLMGIEDTYNFCEGSFEEVKKRSKELIDKIFLPNLSNINEQWEHMSRCMVEGIAMVIPGQTFEVSALHLLWMTGAKPKNFEEQLRWKYKIKYYINRVFLTFFMRFESVRLKFNYWVKSRMRYKAQILLGPAELPIDCNYNLTDKNVR